MSGVWNRVEACHIHSDQEKEALREHFDFAKMTTESDPLGSVPVLWAWSIPIRVMESTPPGVLRVVYANGETRDVPIR